MKVMLKGSFALASDWSWQKLSKFQTYQAWFSDRGASLINVSHSDIHGYVATQPIQVRNILNIDITNDNLAR